MRPPAPGSQPSDNPGTPNGREDRRKADGRAGCSFLVGKDLGAGETSRLVDGDGNRPPSGVSDRVVPIAGDPMADPPEPAE